MSNKTLHLTPIAKVTVTDMIVERLTEFIVNNGMKPGDRLPSERELMERLSVGRSSLREAIKVLKAIGAVEVSVGDGMFVGGGDSSVLSKPLSWSVLMSESNMREVMEARRFIEVELAGLAAQRATDEEIKAIGEILEQSEHDEASGKAIRDIEFHLAIAKVAGNSLLYHVLNTLHRMLQGMLAEIALTYRVGVKPAYELAELNPIYKAIRSRDIQGARQAMENHLLNAKARLPSVEGQSESDEEEEVM